MVEHPCDTESPPVLDLCPSDDGDTSSDLPDEWPIVIADVFCRVNSDGIVLDHVSVTLPDSERLTVTEATVEHVGGTFADGMLVWRWEHGLDTFNRLVRDVGATIENGNTGKVVDHGSGQ